MFLTQWYAKSMEGGFDSYTQYQNGEMPFNSLIEIQTKGPNRFYSHADVYVAISTIYPDDLGKYAKCWASLENSTI
jgi:hypothetical protein